MIKMVQETLCGLVLITIAEAWALGVIFVSAKLSDKWFRRKEHDRTEYSDAENL